MLKIVVMVSGGGTNLQAVIDAIEDSRISDTQITGVISNNKNAYALERAKASGIRTCCVSPKDYESREQFNEKLLEAVDSFSPDLVVLAGFLVVIPPAMIAKYRNRMINIHPSLIPSFCGKGFYGLKVHEAALKRGVKVVGATVHFVDEGTDTGPILLPVSYTHLWPGNPTPRIAETYGGMINAVGLQNPGIEVFCKRDIPFLKKYDTKIIVNVCGKTTEDYCEVVERLAEEPVDLLEINISCPNVKEGGIAFGQDPRAVEAITKEVKKRARQPVIMKLSPNVTDITETARAAEAGGADVLSLINTLTGMKIDVHRRTFALANKTGGLSGPSIKPIAVRMVYQAANAVKVPIIGMGGISCAEDAVEFLLAGASAVSVGTANFFNPAATAEIIEGIEVYLSLIHI